MTFFSGTALPNKEERLGVRSEVVCLQNSNRVIRAANAFKDWRDKMKLVPLFSIIVSSTAAVAAGAIESKIQKIDSQLDAVGSTVVCVQSDRDQVETTANLLNSILVGIKNQVQVSQPSLANSENRSTGICVTVSKK